MVRGLYVAASGMITQRKRMDVLTNNLANLETPGFKKDYTVSRSFDDVLLSRLQGNQNQGELGPFSFGTHVDEVFTRFTQGPLVPTQRNEDLALEGEGFFVVQTPNGPRYTRSGNFTVNGEGYLCTSEGYYVQGTAGRIRVGSGGFSVDASGNVASAAGASRLQIVAFADPRALTKEGGNLYSAAGGGAASAATVKQGYLEQSNVDMAGEVVDMIEVQRAYETNQRIINIINDSLQKAVNEVGRV